MKKKLFVRLFIFNFLPAILSGNVGIAQGKPSKKEIYDFINTQIHGSDSMKVCLEKQPTKSFLGDTSIIFQDTTHFTAADFEYFRLQFRQAESFRWKESQMDHIKTLRRVRIKWIFRNREKGWKRFHKKFESCLFSCSMPVFNVSGTYCIVRWNRQCDGLNGRGGMDLYKWENNQWMFVESYSMWVS